jgi:hypothetical protein
VTGLQICDGTGLTETSTRAPAIRSTHAPMGRDASA